MSRSLSRLQIAGVGVAVVALSAGCGLKSAQLNSLKQAGVNPGVSNGIDSGGTLTPTTGGTTGTSTTGGSSTGGSGTTGSATTGGSTTGGSSTTGGTTTGGTTTGGTTGATTGGTTGGTHAACSAPSGGNTTGITSRGISIGVHAPQTGTGAPLPPSFSKGVQVFWNQPSHKVCGRQVTVDFQDDKYTPATAKAVCEPMSRRDFLIFGAAGTDQIQACATDPAMRGVPYLSAGVTDLGLTSLDNYFGVSLTYEQQGVLVLRNAESRGFAHPKGAGGKWAIVTGSSNNFDSATKGIQDALKGAGVPFDTYRVNQTSDNGLQQRAVSTGVTLAGKGYGTVFVTTSPGYFLYMTGGASKQGYNPHYTGPGVTMTEVTVAQLVCSGTAGLIKANFLAPFPGIDRATADFKAATGGQYDDIYWALWGQAQLTFQMLTNADDNLTRENFIAKTLPASFPAGAFAPVKFAGKHFGGTGVFSQVMDCNHTQPNQSQAGTWDTVGGRIDL